MPYETIEAKLIKLMEKGNNEDLHCNRNRHSHVTMLIVNSIFNQKGLCFDNVDPNFEYQWNVKEDIKLY